MSHFETAWQPPQGIPETYGEVKRSPQKRLGYEELYPPRGVREVAIGRGAGETVVVLPDQLEGEGSQVLWPTWHDRNSGAAQQQSPQTPPQEANGDNQ